MNRKISKKRELFTFVFLLIIVVIWMIGWALTMLGTNKEVKK